MKILVAPDKFKGSLTAAEVADHLAVGLEQLPDVWCARLPLADGGDGSVAAAIAAGFRSYTVDVAGPTGEPQRATIAYDGRTAVVEVANTCGLALLPAGRLEPLISSSLGFGQAVRAALELGPTTVVLALGGSACTDGGLGLLTALGARVTDGDGRAVPPAGGQLGRVARVDLSALGGGAVRWVVAGDVHAVLTGDQGAAQTFGRQKGATPSQIADLDRDLSRLARLCGANGVAAATTPGAGAAGGLGFAALLLGAEMRSGADFFLDLFDFDTQVDDAELVVTGEGRIDDQTLLGKLPSVVARRSAPRPVHVVAGSCQESAEAELRHAFAAIHRLSDLTAADTRRDPDLTAELLRRIGRGIAQAHLTGVRVVG